MTSDFISSFHSYKPYVAFVVAQGHVSSNRLCTANGLCGSFLIDPNSDDLFANLFWSLTQTVSIRFGVPQGSTLGPLRFRAPSSSLS